MDETSVVQAPDWGRNVKVTRGSDGVTVSARCTFYDETSSTGTWEYEDEKGQIIEVPLTDPRLSTK